MKKMLYCIIALLLLICNSCGGGGGGSSAPPPSSSSGSSSGNPSPSPDPTETSPSPTQTTPSPTETTPTQTQTPTPTETTSPSPTQTTQTPSSSPTATIIVESTPAGAQIWVHNNDNPQLPWVDTGKVSPDTYTMPVRIGQSIDLELRKTGYVYYYELLLVAPEGGNDFTFNVNDAVLQTHIPTMPTPTNPVVTPTIAKPVGITYMNNEVYVASEGWKKVQVFDTNLNLQREWSTGATQTTWDIENDSSNLFVSYRSGGGGFVKKFTSSGVFSQQYGTRGDNDGQFYDALGLSILDNEMFVCDSQYSTVHNRIMVFDTNNGNLIRQFGTFGNQYNQFDMPTWVLTTKDNGSNKYVIVVDQSNYIRVFDSNGNFLYWFQFTFAAQDIVAIDTNYILVLQASKLMKFYIKNGEIVNNFTKTNDFHGICTNGAGKFWITDYSHNTVVPWSL